MATWLHCNNCAFQPFDRYSSEPSTLSPKLLLLSECTHVLCERCLHPRATNSCPVCGEHISRSEVIGSRMGQETKFLFQDNLEVIKQLYVSQEFQAKQSNQLLDLQKKENASLRAEISKSSQELFKASEEFCKVSEGPRKGKAPKIFKRNRQETSEQPIVKHNKQGTRTSEQPIFKETRTSEQPVYKQYNPETRTSELSPIKVHQPEKDDQGFNFNPTFNPGRNVTSDEEDDVNKIRRHFRF